MARTQDAYPNQRVASVLKAWADLVHDLETLRLALVEVGDSGANAILTARPQKTVE